MKKSLNNIFDEANSKDIENLVNKNPAPEVSADTLSSVKKKVYSKTGIPNTKNKKPFIFRWQSYATMAACLCLVIGGILFLPKILKISISVEPPSEDKSGTQVILNETNTSESTPAQSSNDTESTTTNNNSNNSNNNKKMNTQNMC